MLGKTDAGLLTVGELDATVSSALRAKIGAR
jgi:hypothetical protein